MDGEREKRKPEPPSPELLKELMEHALVEEAEAERSGRLAVAQQFAARGADPLGHHDEVFSLVFAPLIYKVDDEYLERLATKFLLSAVKTAPARTAKRMFDAILDFKRSREEGGSMHRNALIWVVFAEHFREEFGYYASSTTELRDFICRKRREEQDAWARKVNAATTEAEKAASPPPGDSIWFRFPEDKSETGWRRMWKGSGLGEFLEKNRGGRPRKTPHNKK